MTNEPNKRSTLDMVIFQKRKLMSTIAIFCNRNEANNNTITITTMGLKLVFPALVSTNLIINYPPLYSATLTFSSVEHICTYYYPYF